jgi:hypothetical protein
VFFSILRLSAKLRADSGDNLLKTDVDEAILRKQTGNHTVVNLLYSRHFQAKESQTLLAR